MTVPAETTLCPGDKAGGCESALGAPASVITAISCVPSLLLSTSVLYAHLRTSDAGSGARTIVTCIAAADVLASLGYMVGSVNYRTHQESLGYTPDCYERFLPLCQIQSFVTCMGVMMSLLWTAILAIQVHQSVVKGRVYLERRAMLLCHVVGWGAPTIVSFSLLVGEELGYSTVTAPSWCYVADVDKDYVSPKPKWRITLMAFVGGVFVELCAYVVVIVCTALVACRRESPQLSPSHPHRPISSEQLADRQLLLVPVMVVVLRSWGMIYTIGSLITTDVTNNIEMCLDPNDLVKSFFSILGVLQAICDPGGVGWGALLLYLLRSPKVRGQLWSDMTQLLTCCGLGRRWGYSGRRPSVGTYMYRNSKRVPTVIYAQAEVTPIMATPTRVPSTRTTPTSPMRNAGHFRGRAEITITDSVNSNS